MLMSRVLCKVEGNQRHRVDSLSWSISKQKPLPALESEEDEERKIIFLLCGIADVTEEAEMVI